MAGYQERNRAAFEDKLYRALAAFNLDDCLMCCVYALRAHILTGHEFFEYMWFLGRFFV